ncbi:GNAT family acetyltransferase [Diplogelasinospora grovesii]|uniref:GNAT family acetyltransferase n=1 Tax=Diplogelasinospora grovesii TaxID=303347 RepID=A0AAN6SA16_9PEZI|nr:GNAT family acetyltransferase [Diplogelasinospora grovesii]
MTTEERNKVPLIEGVTLRLATLSDVPSLLGLMDIATAWLAAQGRAGQWGDGSTPHAGDPARVRQATEMAGVCWVLTTTDSTPDPMPTTPTSTQVTTEEGKEGKELKEKETIIGAVAVADSPWPYIQPAPEPERYVRFLITHRAWKGHGLGSMLMDKVRQLARDDGVELVRVDCYAGDDGKLVRWYESQGFEKQEAFMGKGGTWPGMVLSMRIPKEGI